MGGGPPRGAIDSLPGCEAGLRSAPAWPGCSPVPDDLFASPATRLEDRERRCGAGRADAGWAVCPVGARGPNRRSGSTTPTTAAPKPAPLLARRSMGRSPCSPTSPSRSCRSAGGTCNQKLRLAPERRAVPATESGALGPAHTPLEIEWDVEGQLDLLRHLSRHADELADVREVRSTVRESSYGTTLVSPRGRIRVPPARRDLNPKRVIEIGAGASSRSLLAPGPCRRMTAIRTYRRRAEPAVA